MSTLRNSVWLYERDYKNANDLYKDANKNYEDGNRVFIQGYSAMECKEFVPSPPMKASIGDKRFWQGGQRVQQILSILLYPSAKPCQGTLIAPIWSDYAWVLWDGAKKPTTEQVYNIEESD